jgi:excisionase family DNA binding protein
MAEWQQRDLTIDETARFLGVAVSTVRGRLRSGELRSVKTADRRVHVRLSPLEDWLRLPDAASLLGVATSTARAACVRGDLVGRRRGKRWEVKLVSVLEDPRVDPGAAELFGGSPTPLPPPEPARPRPSKLTRAVYVRLSPEEAETLDRLQLAAGGGYGSMGAVVAAALRVLDDQDAGDVATGDELAGLRAELHARGEALERVRAAHRNVSERARERLVDEIYCPVCEHLVAIEEVDVVAGTDGGAELVHKGHPHRQGSRLRRSTVAARRRPLPG